MSRRVAWALVSWALAVAVATQEVELVPLPESTLDDMEEVVREAFQERRVAIAELLAAPELDRGRLAVAYADLGRLNLSYGRREEAEACLRNATLLQPADFRWSYLLGALYQNDQRPDDAVRHLERALELEPGYAPAWVRLGEAHLLRGDPAAARGFFEKALLAGEEAYGATALYGLGRAAAAADDHAAATEHFTAALRLRPKANAIHHSLGLAYRDLGDRDKARHHLRQGGQLRPRFRDPLLRSLMAEGAITNMQRGLVAARRGNYEQAAEYHKKAVEADPNNATVRRELGSALLELRDYDGAIAEYREALELQPESPLTQLALAFALAERGGGGDGEEALAIAERVREQAPGYADAHAFLGRQYERQGRIEEARAAFESALAADPKHLDARQDRARLKGLAGDVESAVQELEELLGEEPGRLGAVLDLTTLLARSGDSAAAVDRLRATLELDLEPAGRALVLFNLGTFLQQERRDEEALSAYDEVLRLEPGYADAHFNRASLLLRRGRGDEAAAAFARVLELEPGDPRAHLGRARALARAGRDAEARDGLEDALVRLPGDAFLTHELARLLAASRADGVRDGARALELAQAALQASPQPEYAETVAMALAELGRFDEAVAWQRGILEQARQASSPPALVRRLEGRLELYVREEPYRFE